MKPRPEPVDPFQLYDLAHAVIKAAKFPVLATVDSGSHPRVRPVSPVRVDPDFTVYVANLASYHNTSEIAANPLLKQYLGTPDNPEFILDRIVPKQVRFMREWALDYHEVPAQAS